MKQELLFEGKEKQIYATGNESEVVILYKDDTTAFGGIKKALIKDKGLYCAHISALAFEALNKAGIPTHFISRISDNELLCRKMDIRPLQLYVRNRICDTTAKLLGKEQGTRIPNTLYEWRYNNDKLSDPMINDDHAVALGFASYEELNALRDLAHRANEVLKEFFHKAGIELVDFKMGFGVDKDGSFVVADEITPDNCRLWDEQTGKVLDKDRFRFDKGEVGASYREVMERLESIGL